MPSYAQETGVIKVGTLAKIRRLYFRDKQSIKEICRQTGMSRNTVRSWLRDPEIDTSDWHFATEQVEQLVRQIVDQAGDLGDQATKLRRRLARRQQLFAALPNSSD